MLKRLPTIALAAAVAIGAAAAPAAFAQGDKQAAQKADGPSPAEMQAYQAANKLEDPSARAAAYRTFLAENPKSPLESVVRQRLVDALAEAKAPAADILAASAQAEAGLSAGPALAGLLNLVANALAERGERLDVAATYAQRSIAAVPPGEDFAYMRWAAQDTLGWVQYKQGDYPKAVASLSEAAAGAGEDQTVLYHLGAAYEKAGRTDEAIEAYTRASGVFLGTNKEVEPALRALYEKKHGSLDGLDARLAAARDRSRQVRVFEAPKFEKAAPAWELKDLAGKPVKFADLKGKVVIMDFWGSWCPPCRAELPYFQALYNKYKDQGVVFLGMNWERPAEPAARMKAVGDFMTTNKYSFPVVIDHDQVAVKALEVKAYPTVFLVDKSGTIRYRNVGYEEGVEQILEAQLQSLMK